MPQDPGTCDPEEFLRQDRWLRELVRSLAQEVHVDDVVQDTWAAALQHSRGARVPRGWLRTVARHFAWRALRSADRRGAREAEAAREEALPSTAETLAWIELQREVARAVQELEEPQRTAILLRYTHGRSTREIAQETATSEENVRQRLKRGRDCLRRTLEMSLGRDWSQGPSRALWWIPGVLEMKLRKSVLVVVALILLAPLAVIGALWLGESRESEAGSPSLEPASVEEVAATLERLPRGAAVAREALTRGNASEQPGAVIDEPPALGPITGQVLDSRGVGLAGVVFGAVPWGAQIVPPEGVERPGVEFRTGRDGSLEWNTERANIELQPATDWVVIAGTRVRDEADSRSQQLIVLAPAVSRSGVVMDGEGRALVDVEVSVTRPELLDFPHPLEYLFATDWSSLVTDAGGAFSFRDLPGECASLKFEKEGHLSRTIRISNLVEQHLDVVLDTFEDMVALTGQVLSPAGVPVAGALVGLGKHSTRSDNDGRFRLDLPRDACSSRPNCFYAAAPPWRTWTDAGIVKRLLAAEEGQLDLEVIFEGETLAIAGRVIDAEGDGAAGLLVYLWAEDVLADDRSAEEFSRTVDAPVLEVGPGLRVWAKTDADGNFLLEGLGEREYVLRIYDRQRQAGMTTDKVRAGTRGNLFTLPPNFVVAELHGRVQDHDGHPVDGARVSALVGEFASSRSYHSVSSTSEATTGAEGRFTLRDVAGSALDLSVWGPDILRERHALSGTRVGELVITVDRRCYFRVLIDDEDMSVAFFHVLDARDEPITIGVLGLGTYQWSTSGQLQEGRTRVLATGQEAAAVVLYSVKDRQLVEVARQVVQFQAEGTNEVRF